jgi:predicted MFS family arabinose efflux permease
LKQIDVNSSLAYLFLAFIAMSGLSYINFLPGVVNVLAVGLGFGEVAAGRIVALNGYGGIVGTAAAVFIVRRLDWRQAMLPSLLVLVAVDYATIWIDDYDVMLVWRFLAGIVGGLSVGIGFSVLARLNNPDKAFGLLLFIQFSVGSLVIYLLPVSEAQLGEHAVFYVMAGLVLLATGFLFLLPELPNDRRSASSKVIWSRNTLFLILAILGYQIAASAIWAYAGLIGLKANITAEAVSLYIALTGMLGLAGAMLPVVTGRRFGRFYWVLTGAGLSVLASLLLDYAHVTSIYILAMALLFFSWPAVQSFMLAMTADIDESGQLSTAAGFVSSVGLATGPLLASSLLVESNFSAMLIVSALIFLACLGVLVPPLRALEPTDLQKFDLTGLVSKFSQSAIECHRETCRFVSDLPRKIKEGNMIRYLFNKALLAMQSKYDYDVRYQQDILKSDLKAYLKFTGFQIMASHGGNLPAGPLHAARIRAIIWDDCGPCTQLAVNMALEAQVHPDIVGAIVDRDLESLPEDVALVVRFADLVLEHNPEADDLRDKILHLWGEEGLIAIGFCISSMRVYPALKYTLGYGKACSRVTVNDLSLAPNRQPELVTGAGNA